MYLLLGFSLVTLAQSQNIQPNLIKKAQEELNNCVCAEIYMPVCAEGKTYSNPCSARCQKAKNFVTGACDEIKPSKSKKIIK